MKKLIIFSLMIFSCSKSIPDSKNTTINPEAIADGSSVSSQEVSVCPNDMVEVNGDFCPEVDQECVSLDTKIHNANGYVKCDKYSKTKCLSKNRTHMHFCMDTYEWPNRKGELPSVMISWYDMKRNCESVGKRLCQDTEWTFACEGEEALPYPYGYERNSKMCNIDNPQKPGFDASRNAMTDKLVEYLDQRVPSGTFEGCVSPFGVHDMTGNVDEFTVNSSGKPYKSSLKGGAWLLGHRARCRPATIAHNEDFKYYAEGGRCCKSL